MNKVTMQLPVGNVTTGEKYGVEDFTGYLIEGMFIHPTFPDQVHLTNARWTVTHVRTGRSIKKGLRSRKVAIALAKKLSALNCWDFDDAASARSIAPELLTHIRDLCREAA